MRDDYQNIYSVESFGGGHFLGLKIQGVFPHKLSEEAQSEIYRLGDKIKSTLYWDAERANSLVMESIKKDKESILSLFPTGCCHKEIPNGYYRDPNRPWFVVFTLKGPIEIGWRKRVISISWKDTAIEQTADQLFPYEDVTKDGKLIHAWGYEKAQEYINRILQ